MAADPSGVGASSSAAALEQQQQQRRPRVREVSSRFMSPLLIQSNSTDFPRSKSTANRRHYSNNNKSTDENHDTTTITTTNNNHHRSSLFDNNNNKSSSVLLLRKNNLHHPRVNKQHNNKENGDHHHHHPRPDTPIAADRIVPSRYRQQQQQLTNNTISSSSSSSSVYRSNSFNTSTSTSSSSCTTTASVTAASRLLQQATSSHDYDHKNLSRISTSSPRDHINSQGSSSSCPNSPLCVLPPGTTKVRSTSVTDARSSMPDVEKWLTERNYTNAAAKDCARSLNFSSTVKMIGGGGEISLPPHPSSSYVRSSSGLDVALLVKKGRKGVVVPNQHEDVHSLKMFTNHFLQWRFANAKAEAAMRAQKHDVETKFCSLGAKISEMRDSVKRKHNQLAALRRIQTLTTIVEAQMPYLDEWSVLEEDYSTSLSETTNALVSSSIRIPVSGEVRANVGELGEALNSALKVVEMIGSHIQSFAHKAEEMDVTISELARMAGGETALIEECGDLMSEACVSQVKECSLRGTLMQFHQAKRTQATS